MGGPAQGHCPAGNERQRMAASTVTFARLGPGFCAEEAEETGVGGRVACLRQSRPSVVQQRLQAARRDELHVRLAGQRRHATSRLFRCSAKHRWRHKLPRALYRDSRLRRQRKAEGPPCVSALSTRMHPLRHALCWRCALRSAGRSASRRSTSREQSTG